MIDIEKLTEEDIGREVKYDNGYIIDYGRITSFNKLFVFVDYGTGHGQATYPHHLTWSQSNGYSETPKP